MVKTAQIDEYTLYVQDGKWALERPGYSIIATHEYSLSQLVLDIAEDAEISLDDAQRIDAQIAEIMQHPEQLVDATEIDEYVAGDLEGYEGFNIA